MIAENFAVPAAAWTIAACLFLPDGAWSASYRFDLQPVAICETQNTCYRPGFDLAYLHAIFAQTDIAVTVRQAEELHFPELPTFVSGPEYTPKPLLLAFADELQPEANTVYVGFTPDLAGPVVGIAFQNDVSNPFAIVQASLAPRLQGSIVAHEIGHVLGAGHNERADDLMARDYDAWKFNMPNYLERVSAEDAEVFRSSPLLVETVSPVPVPPAFLLLVSGLVLICLRRRPVRSPPSGSVHRISPRASCLPGSVACAQPWLTTVDASSPELTRCGYDV